MASHYRLYDGMGEVVPFNARYSYPTQANRSWKSLVKIPPKNGSIFNSNQNPTIRIELPAQSYLDTANSFLQFDLEMKTLDTSTNCHLQNNVQSWIKRARWVYGSLVGEDIRDYNVLVRNLTEGTGTNNTFILDQTSLTEGVGGIRATADTKGVVSFVNVRNFDIQSRKFTMPTTANDGALKPVANVQDAPRRYQVQLALGLFQQNKLIPLKWMASQLALELEMADFDECMCHDGPPAPGDYYQVTNVNFVAQLLEFDGTYDAAFLEGLRGGGVPIKFATWDTFMYTPAPSDRQTIMIPERNRSIKCAFCVQLPPRKPSTDGPASHQPWDSHAFLESSQNLGTDTGCSEGWLVNYQWRIGGKYYPAQQVTCGDTSKSNGGIEAYMEYAKALNIVGDYRLSTALNTTRWVRTSDRGDTNPGSHCIDWQGVEKLDTSYWTLTGPSAFVISGDFETTNGDEVSGLNGEEQNDIALMIQYSGPQNPMCSYDIFVYCDALLILRDNNLVELIK